MAGFHQFVIMTLLGMSRAASLRVPDTPVTPVEKVISLLEDLKSEIEGEGNEEASTYDDFACFCKDQTKTKSDSIVAGRDDIDRFSGDIEKNTAEKEDLEIEVSNRKVKQEELSSELDATKAQHAKDKAEYDAVNADLSKAVSSLEGAKTALSDAKPTASSFIAMRESIAQTLALADAMKLIEIPKRQAVVAFFQQTTKVDPNDASYKYHSQGILDTIDQLLVEFRAELASATSEWQKTDLTATATISSLEGEMQTNSDAIDTAEGDIEDFKGTIASDRTALVSADGTLRDDKLYLKDLTARCEARAHDWDQRTQLRGGELEAITAALSLLKNNVTTADTSVNQRALLLQRTNGARGVSARVAPHNMDVANLSVPSFLQEALDNAHMSQAKKERVVAMLQQEAHRLGSVALSNLAVHASADPFGKVKELIQKLIQRLVREATSEATKKGFCDEALGKAKKDRDFRYADTKKLNSELAILEAKEDELVSEIELLNASVASLNVALTNATDLRAVEKRDNLATIKEAKEGFKAVTEAVTILKVFYKQGARAKVLLQASPVDEDTDGAGFAGAYKGKQTASKGIIGLLEVIQTDFDRTVRTTEAAEASAHAEFVVFDRTSRADIRGKETKQALDEEDLKTTRNLIEGKMSDLQTAMNLLDTALESLEDLKPTCIDTGMSYADRVAKREEEIVALKRAVCILDTEGVETEFECAGN